MPSTEDEAFLQIMNREFTKDDSKSWVAPLPFCTPRPRLQNNREQALSRLMSLRRPLKRKEEVEDPKNLHNDSTFRSSDKRGLHLKAIAAVAYLKVMDAAGHSEAVLAVEIAEGVSVDLNIASDDISRLFFTDSKVVRGYIFSDSQRFYVNVHNRVQRI